VPPISIVVPARDEECTIVPLLVSLTTQTLPAAEIVVVDAGSKDSTAALVATFGASVRLVKGAAAYPGRARNIGVRVARHDWIAFIDAGCVADARWLESLIEAAVGSKPCTMVVYGDYEPIIRGPWDVAQVLGIVPPRCRRTGTRPPFIASSLVHRAVWERVGGFPEAMRAAEDLIFFRRITSRGFASAVARRALVTWLLPAGPQAFFNRLRLYSAHHLGSGLARTWHARVAAMDIAALGLLLLGPFWSLRAWLALVVVAATRVGWAIWQRRSHIPPAGGVDAFVLGRVAGLLLLADVAAWAGGYDLLRQLLNRRKLTAT